MPASPIRLASNLSSTQLAVLASALHLSTTPGSYADADLIVVESMGGKGDLTEQEAAEIAERVRRGATLLVTMGEVPQTAAMKLGAILPAIMWRAAGTRKGYAPGVPIAVGFQDKEMFSGASLEGFALPYSFPVVPISAAERGQSRYAGYKRTIGPLKRSVEAGDQFWTRPLLLRDVKVRLRGNDHASTPLMATALYGAGRTMLFGSGFDQLAAPPSILPAVVAWMQPKSVVFEASAGAAPEMRMERGQHSVLIHVKADTPAEVEVVGRAYTWENAPLGFEHDLRKKVVLAPGKAVTVEMPLPMVSDNGAEALEYRDAFRVRVGVLGASGASLLVEQQMAADFTPAVDMEVLADDINHWEYPFHAPGINFQRAFKQRMGAAIGAYAYPPGAKVAGSITLTNGVRNLAPMAVVSDQTTVGNVAVIALVDGAIVGEKTPLDSVTAYSMWMGKPGVENVLAFTFPHPVTLTCVTLVGSLVNREELNPEEVSMKIDGRPLASASNLTARFQEGSGKARLEFAPSTGTVVTMTFPMMPPVGSRRRRSVGLTEVEMEGWDGSTPPAVKGELMVTLENALTGASQPISRQAVALKSGERRRIAVPYALPETTGAPAFYRMQATFLGSTRSTPVLTLTPPHPLGPMTDILPANIPDLGPIVTLGFRSGILLGTGTAERIQGSWASPDDLIWAYSHQMKEVGRASRTQANRMYVTEGDMRHYSTPWRTFSSGVPFYDDATVGFVESMSERPHWAESKVVHLGHSDRWDTGPMLEILHGWQDFVEFDAHLRSLGKPGLKGKIRSELTAEIHDEHEDEWEAWQLAQYLHNLRTLRNGFAAQGKRLVITAQGVPVIAGPVGAEVAKTVQGMSDDHTWGMQEGSVSMTTGRQLAELAHNPVWKMSTLVQYGFVHSTLNNFEWHSPTATVEPSRRLYYDRAWRATVWPDGRYGSVYAVGYNENVGISYQMNENDWRQWWQIEERHSLLSPEEPIGAGLVISTIRFADPKHIRFTAASVLDNSEDGRGLARTFQRLHDAGLSMPFAANVSALAQWKGNAPLIILYPEVFTEEEIGTLEKLQSRGIRMAAFSSAASLQPRVAALFSQPGSLIRTTASELTPVEANLLAPALRKLLGVGLELSAGVSGYGFTMSGTHFVVMEDWREEGRVAQFRLRATEGKTTAQACTVNEHGRLIVRRDGTDWVVDVPLRSGDGQVVALREA